VVGYLYKYLVTLQDAVELVGLQNMEVTLRDC